MNRFNSLAPREKWLILTAVGLSVLFALWQFLISPVLTHAETAQRELEVAKRDHMIVSRGLPKMALQTGGVNKAVFNRNSVIETARNANVSISRVQPGSDGSLQVRLDDSPTGSVYAFLTELENRYRVSTTKAQLTRRDGGTVSAQFTFIPRG